MKTILLLNFLIAGFTSLSQINNGMISQYYFCGNANDVVGPNNGIVRGANLTTDRFGNSNSAYSFNGVNNLINLGTSNSLKSGTMSISLWAKITSYTNTNNAYSNQPFITTRSRNADFNFEAYFVGMYSPTSKIDAATTSTSGLQNAILSNITASVGVWNHVVYMFRQDSTFLYINGVFQQQVFKNFASGYLIGDSVTLGYVGSGLSTKSFLNGCLDDVRIYNRQLTSSEVNQLYIEPNTKPTINVVTNRTLLCVGQSATLTASGASTYTWSPGGVGTSISVSPTITTNYTLNGMAINGCSNTNTITQNVSACTGIETNSNSNFEIKIYPNPNVSGIFKIESTDVTSIKIVNLLGQVVYQNINIKGISEIDLSNQNSSVYYISIDYEQKTKIQKLIIAK